MADNITSGNAATSPYSSKLLDTVFSRESPLTEEQFSFIIYHAVQGAGSADILTLVNGTFSLEENISTVEETISWIRRNVQREGLLLTRAKQYEWHLPVPPSAGNNAGSQRDRKWTDDMRAFILWKHELGHRKLTVLDSLNAQFKTQFSIGSMKVCLTNITNHEQTAEFLREYATSLDWWKPPPAPDSPEGVRIARHARRRAASKRLAERGQAQKQWIDGFNRVESEELQSPEAATGKGKTRASTTAADGTLFTPVKIEDSDGDGDTMSDAVLTHFNEIADEMVPSPSDQLSPTFLQQAPPRRPRREVDDGGMELTNDSDEEAGANLNEYSSGGSPKSSTSNNRSGKGVSNFSAKLMGSRS